MLGCKFFTVSASWKDSMNGHPWTEWWSYKIKVKTWLKTRENACILCLLFNLSLSTKHPLNQIWFALLFCMTLNFGFIIFHLNVVQMISLQQRPQMLASTHDTTTIHTVRQFSQGKQLDSVSVFGSCGVASTRFYLCCTDFTEFIINADDYSIIRESFATKGVSCPNVSRSPLVLSQILVLMIPKRGLVLKDRTRKNWKKSE